jgi:hypothetical protein
LKKVSAMVRKQFYANVEAAGKIPWDFAWLNDTEE